MTVLNAEFEYVINVGTSSSIGTYFYLIYTTKVDEVIDVACTHLERKSLENVFDIDAHKLDAAAVKLNKILRSRTLEERCQRTQCRIV